jgi:hypothetical protein
VGEALAQKVVAAVHRLRLLEMAKPPGVAETLDWIAAIGVVGADDLDVQTANDTLGAIVKDRDDLDLVRDQLDVVVGDR